MTCFAEACLNDAFKDYRLIYDDVEGGALMDIANCFGKEVANKLEAPSYNGDVPIMSDTVESFYYHISDLVDEGRPFIYVLDSQDSLTSTASEEKFHKQKAAREEGKDAKGSYGDGKAKYHSEHLRLVLSKLRRMGSILIVIGQTRDNLGFGFAEKTRSGGKALRFYANLEIWSSVVGKITRKVRGRDRVVGSKIQLEIKKNRLTGKIGKDRSVVVPILYGLGFDDIASCVSFLIQEKHWKKSGSGFEAPEISCSGSKAQIIAHIEENNLEHTVRKLTGKVWRQVEAECIVPRKKRYT